MEEISKQFMQPDEVSVIPGLDIPEFVSNNNAVDNKLVIENERLRRKLKVMQMRTEERKSHNRNVAIAIASLSVLAGIGMGVTGKNISDNMAIEKSMEPVKEYTADLINDNKSVVFNYDEYGVNDGYAGVALDKQNLASAMDLKFNESEAEGRIYLSELMKELNSDEDRDYVLQHMNDENVLSATSMDDYVNKLGYDSLDDFYKAQEKLNYNLSQIEEQEGPKL